MNYPPQQMQPGGMPIPPQQMQQQPMIPQQAQQQQQQQQQKDDKDKLLSRARDLVGPLKEKWAATVREAAYKVNPNVVIAAASASDSKFESNLEDLYAICDQIEASLQTAIDCVAQTNRSNSYMPITPQPSKLDMTPGGAAQQQQPEFLPYPQYIATSKQQVAFANEIKQLLNQAAKDVVEREWRNEPAKRAT